MFPLTGPVDGIINRFVPSKIDSTTLVENALLITYYEASNNKDRLAVENDTEREKRNNKNNESLRNARRTHDTQNRTKFHSFLNHYEQFMVASTKQYW